MDTCQSGRTVPVLPARRTDDRAAYVSGWARKLSVPEIEADIGIALQTAQDLITAINAEILKRRPVGPV